MADPIDFVDACKHAALKIQEADILMLSIGAGFSADSGLAVYKDIADIPAYHKKDLTYSDICQPKWLRRDPNLFYGFWGKCFNDYRQTPPHEGYQIVQKWKDSKFSANELNKDSFPSLFNQKYTSQWNLFLQNKPGNTEKLRDPNVGPFFIYSSNVDSHPVVAGFNKNEIYEIHGSVEYWHCSEKCKKFVGYDKIASGELWKAPENMIFQINDDMEALDADAIEGLWDNHPKCNHCGKLARPSILMFGDGGWIEDTTGFDRYRKWETNVLDSLEEGKKLVILEIGCGTRVATVRWHNEVLINRAPKDAATLVRINPEEMERSFVSVKSTVIEIPSTGLKALIEIDSYLSF